MSLKIYTALTYSSIVLRKFLRSYLNLFSLGEGGQELCRRLVRSEITANAFRLQLLQDSQNIQPPQGFELKRTVRATTMANLISQHSPPPEEVKTAKYKKSLIFLRCVPTLRNLPEPTEGYPRSGEAAELEKVELRKWCRWEENR